MRKYEVHLDIDSRCNFDCFYCCNSTGAMSAENRKALAPLPPDRLRDLLPKLDAICWHVYLSCAGEPFMHPRWKDVVEAISASKMSCDMTLVTNGRLMNAPRAESVVRAGITRLFVSIDSVDAETFARLCRVRVADFESVLTNVRELVRIRGGAAFPKIFVTAILMKSTREGLANVARWVVENGLDGLKTQWLEAGLAPGLGPEVVGLDDRTQAVLNETEAVLAAGGKSHDFPYVNTLQKLRSVLNGRRFVRNKWDYLKFWGAKVYQSRQPGGCRLAGLSMNLRQDGVLQMCPQSDFASVDLVACPVSVVKQRVDDAVRRFRAAPVKECEGCSLRNPL